DVAQLAVLPDIVEQRERVPNPGALVALRPRRADRLAVLAVGFAPVLDVVAPRDVVLVEEVGDVGPRVVHRRSAVGDRLVHEALLHRRGVRTDDVVATGICGGAGADR